MKIYTIRHGETEANAEGRFQGRYDGRLNRNGIELAEETAAGIAKAGIRFDECFSSPLSRAAETARIVLEGSGNGSVPVHYDDRLMEVDVGGWDMVLISEMKRTFIGAYLSNPFLLTKEQMRGGETMEEVCARTQGFLRELMSRNDDKCYLVSTHGCAVRAMCSFLHDGGDFWQGHLPYNCSVNVIEVKDGKAELLELDRIFYDPAKCVDHYALR